MNYIKLKSLKDLLNEYVNNEETIDKGDILFKLNKDVLDNLAIIVSRHLDDGKEIEDIIRNKLEEKVLSAINEVIKFNDKNGSYIKPKELEKCLKSVISKKI
jgi:ABC-type branched-subunit amino acid transport system substrate-binding protein